MRILIVDDSRVMRTIVARTLRQAGFGDHEFVEASNGREAFDAIVADKPDLVLSDWNMPEMNGLDLLHALRRNQIDVTFGFVTSEGSSAMRELAAAAGARFLIAKPFTDDTFSDALEEVLT